MPSDTEKDWLFRQNFFDSEPDEKSQPLRQRLETETQHLDSIVEQSTRDVIAAGRNLLSWWSDFQALIQGLSQPEQARCVELLLTNKHKLEAIGQKLKSLDATLYGKYFQNIFIWYQRFSLALEFGTDIFGPVPGITR